MAEVDPVKLALLSEFGAFITPEMAEPIFEKAAEVSVVQQLARQIPLSPDGKAIPYFTGDVEADWVEEAGEKPVVKAGAAVKSFAPHKIAAIAVVSKELLRKDPARFMKHVRTKIAESFAKKFDAAVLHGDAATTFGASNFLDATSRTAVELGTTTSANGGTYVDLVNGYKTLTDADVDPTGFAFDKRVLPVLMKSVDTTGRPLWTDSPYNGIPLQNGSVLGLPAVAKKRIGSGGTVTSGDANVRGYLGDWSQVVWGAVGGIEWSVSTETALPIGDEGAMISLFQHNLIAILAEAEYGFLVNDPNSFVQYLDAV